MKALVIVYVFAWLLLLVVLAVMLCASYQVWQRRKRQAAQAEANRVYRERQQR